jgi:hypothetical protein
MLDRQLGDPVSLQRGQDAGQVESLRLLACHAGKGRIDLRWCRRFDCQNLDADGPRCLGKLGEGACSWP